MYKNIPTSIPTDDNRVHNIYLEWLNGRTSAKVNQLLHTTYKEIEKNVTALGIKW